MSKAKRLSALLLAAVLASSAVGCGNTNEASEDTQISNETTEGLAEAVEEEPVDFLEGVKYDGVTFSIMTSDTTISSNYMIEGSGELNGDNVNDAVFQRNIDAEERLGIKMIYTQTNRSWDKVSSEVTQLIMAGEDSYDLLIDDQRGLSSASVKRVFYDAATLSNVDFNEGCWQRDYMLNLSVNYKCIFLLVGDYFMDVLNHAHSILYNRDIYRDLYGDPDELYKTVQEGDWVYDEWSELITGAYSDTNGNGKVDIKDTLGLIVGGIGGSSFPFTYGTDIPFVSRDENGYPTLTMYGDRLLTAYEKIYNIFYNSGTCTKYSENGADLHKKFMSNEALFISGCQLGDFGTFRDMENEVGIIPYPKLDDQQEDYITVIHDTAEVGVIPVTARDPEMTGAVCQILCRLSHDSVLPTYYETSLKIKYARDSYTAAMIDLIHNGVKDEFCLVYGGDYAADIFTWAILGPLQAGTDAVTSKYQSLEKSAIQKLAELAEAFENAESLEISAGQ